MLKANYSDRSISSTFILSLLVVLASWLFFQVLGMLSGKLLFQLSFSEMASAFSMLDEPRMIGFLKYLQTLTSIGMFAVSSWIIASLIGRPAVNFLKLDYLPGVSVIVLASLLMLFSLPLNNFLTHLNAELKLPAFMNGLQDYFVKKEEQGVALMNAFLDHPGAKALLINIFVVAVVPALAEELFFRGILQTLIIRWLKNAHLGIVVTGLVFALLHFQFLSALPRIVQGIILGYLFYWTASMWIVIIAHFINNAAAVLYYHYYFRGTLGQEMEQIGTPGSGYLYYAIISTILVAFILFAIKGRMKESQPIS